MGDVAGHRPAAAVVMGRLHCVLGRPTCWNTPTQPSARAMETSWQLFRWPGSRQDDPAAYGPDSQGRHRASLPRRDAAQLRRCGSLAAPWLGRLRRCPPRSGADRVGGRRRIWGLALRRVRLRRCRIGSEPSPPAGPRRPAAAARGCGRPARGRPARRPAVTPAPRAAGRRRDRARNVSPARAGCALHGGLAASSKDCPAAWRPGALERPARRGREHAQAAGRGGGRADEDERQLPVGLVPGGHSGVGDEHRGVGGDAGAEHGGAERRPRAPAGAATGDVGERRRRRPAARSRRGATNRRSSAKSA